VAESAASMSDGLEQLYMHRCFIHVKREICSPHVMYTTVTRCLQHVRELNERCTRHMRNRELTSGAVM
jgi:hypothetical protein